MKKLNSRDARQLSIALVIASFVLLACAIIVVMFLDRSQWWVWLIFSVLLTGAVAAIIIPFLLPTPDKNDKRKDHSGSDGRAAMTRPDGRPARDPRQGPDPRQRYGQAPCGDPRMRSEQGDRPPMSGPGAQSSGYAPGQYGSRHPMDGDPRGTQAGAPHMQPPAQPPYPSGGHPPRVPKRDNMPPAPTQAGPNSIEHRMMGRPGGNQVVPAPNAAGNRMSAQPIGGESDGFMFYGVMRPNGDEPLDIKEAAISAISAISAITAESAERADEAGAFSGEFSSPSGNVSISMSGIIDRVPWADAPAQPSPPPDSSSAQDPQPVGQALPNAPARNGATGPTAAGAGEPAHGAATNEPDPSTSANMTDATIARIPAGSIRLTFDDQTVIYLKDSIVIGRNPSRSAEFQDADVFAIMDEALSVSKTHAALTASNGAVIVKDLHSTNGTRVVDAEGKSTVVQPGAEVWATDGATIVLGSREIRVGVGR